MFFYATDLAGNEWWQFEDFNFGTVPSSDGVADLTTGSNQFLVAMPDVATDVEVGETVTLTAHVTGPTGTFQNPFERVNFYWVDQSQTEPIFGSPVQRLIGEATSVSTSDDGVTRTWIYSITLDTSGLDPAANVPIYAIGFDGDGDALRTQFNTNVSIVPVP